MKNFKKLTPKQKILITSAIIVLFIAFPLVFISYKRINNSIISFFVAPSSATIKLDGKIVESGIKKDDSGYLEIKPINHAVTSGKHTIEIVKDGFNTIKEEIELNPNSSFMYYNYLSSENDPDWYSKNEEESRLLETIIPKLSQQKQEDIEDKYPLIKHLPLNIDYYTSDLSKHVKYSISYIIEEDKVSIKITDLSGNNKTLALDKIKSLGFSPDDYNIEYIDSSESGWGKAL